MFTKTKIAVAAALIFGAASAVQAANENDGGNETGGYSVGPMGQHFGGANPVYHGRYRYRYGGGAFAFVPRYRVPYRHERRWGW
jgi:hypothetical protein